MNQYDIIKSIDAPIGNPNFWIELIQSQEDFSIVINREILQSMLGGFEMLMNQKAKEVYFEQQKQRIIQIDQMYQEQYGLGNQSSIQREYQNIKTSNHDIQTEITMIKQQITHLQQSLTEKNQIITAEHQQLLYQQQQLEQELQQFEQQLIDIKRAKDETSSRIVDLIEKFNAFIPRYEELYNSYSQYKQSYDDKRKEREILRQQVYHK